MTRDLREALGIPAGSRWNIGLKSASFAFVVKCSIAKREILLNFFCGFCFWGHKWMLCILHVML